MASQPPPPPYGGAPQYGAPQYGPPQYGAPPPAKKKSNLLIWILVIVLGLGLLVVGGAVFTFYFVANKVKQAGFDPDLIQRNPAEAITKMMVAANPNLEVLNVDEGKGLVTIKDKSTGKTVTINLDDAKQGKISITSDEGSVRIGSGGKMPDWVPVYPGATQQSHMASKTNEGDGGMVTFTIQDSPDKVASFYDNALKGAGFEVKSNSMTTGTAGVGGAIEAEKGEQKVAVMMAGAGSTTTVTLTYTDKK